MGKIKDTVSVIIPVYNRENTIARCLNSVLSQTYTELEIICIDDGSTDHSLKVMKDIAAGDERISVIDLPKNGGVSNARNVGIENANGDWIAFVDSDDMILPDMISDMVQTGGLFAIDMVLSDLDMICQGVHQGLKIALQPGHIYHKEVIREKILPCFSYSGPDNLALFSFSTKLYRASVLQDNTIRFNPEVSWQEDKLFVIEALANCNTLCYIDKYYYQYEVGAGLYTTFRPGAWISSVNLYRYFVELTARYAIPHVNMNLINEDFVFNITWFLYRSKRVENSRNLQNMVIKSEDVQDICSAIVDTLSSFDRRMVKAILTKNRALVMLVVDFVYGGTKDKLMKIAGSVKK